MVMLMEMTTVNDYTNNNGEIQATVPKLIKVQSVDMKYCLKK